MMNLAKVSLNGQVTVPIEIRKELGLKSGDKLIFFKNSNGEIVIDNATPKAIAKAQNAFTGVAETLGINSIEDVQKLVNEIRHNKGLKSENPD